MKWSWLGSYLLMTLLLVFLLLGPYVFAPITPERESEALRVMAYSSLIQEWGAGPEIARRFEEETGLPIEWINAGNAGLLLERLKFKGRVDRPDVVMGLDQFAVMEARKSFSWSDVRNVVPARSMDLLPRAARFHDFLAYDWGPLTFIYREGEVEPPSNLDDLMAERFKKNLILQDPRMSSPGLQFLVWILNAKGEVEAFEYLEKLKSSVAMVSPSWSSSYNLFRVQPNTMVFSYFSSPFFHLIEEQDNRYRAVTMEEPHPVQVEYAGIPETCRKCEQARAFLQFLGRVDIQKLLMQKNYMYPVKSEAMKGTEFSLPEGIRYYDPAETLTLTRKRRRLMDEWKKVFY